MKELLQLIISFHLVKGLVNATLRSGDRTIVKKIPSSLTVGRLKQLCRRLLEFDVDSQVCVCVVPPQPS